MQVEVYWNLHRNIFSVRSKGVVIEHASMLNLHDCLFVVQPAGNAKVRSEQRKNVHAFIRGTYISSSEKRSFDYERSDIVTYNPYKYDTFVIPYGNNDAVHQADYVHMCINTDNKPTIYAYWQDTYNASDLYDASKYR
jgi:hypothetical protein